MTGLELATAALETIGAHVPLDGDPSGDDVALALRVANRLRQSWNAKGLALHAIQRATYTWPSATTTRTIGAAGQLVGPMPLQVLAAGVIPVGETRQRKVDVIEAEAYAAIPDITQTQDVFHEILYERTAAAVGTLTVWPVPTTAPTLVLTHRIRLALIEDATEIDVPGEYEEALVLALSKRIAPTFTKPWTRELEDLHRDAWATVQRANIRIPQEMCMPAGFPGTGRGAVSDADYDGGLV